MAENLFSLSVELDLNSDGFQDALKQVRKSLDALVDDADDTAEKVRKGGEKAKSGWQGIADDLKQAFSFSIGTLIADGIKAAGQAIIEFSKESIELASDLDEVQNVVDVTFGEGAKTIDSWSQSLISSFGLSELKAKKYSSTMGAMLKSMGLTDSQVLTMSQDMTELAADMASFYNLEHDEAFEKIRAGISGETEPLKQLGINMSVANMEAYAMSQGITKSYNAMTQAEQALLRYNYLMSVTSDAQGDFARTSDSYANSLKQLQENLSQISAQFGADLISAITPAINTLNDWLTADDFQSQLMGIETTKDSEMEAANNSYGVADYLIRQLEEIKASEGDAAETTKEWETALKALKQVMPELGQYIDDNTGKLLVSTEELRNNADAIRNLALYDAQDRAKNSYQQKVDDALTKLTDKQVELMIAQGTEDRWQRIYDGMLAKIISQAGGMITEEDIWGFADDIDYLTGLGIDKRDLAYFFQVTDTLEVAEGEVEKLSGEVTTLTGDLEDAEEAQKNAELALAGYSDLSTEQAKATRDYSTALDNQAAALDKVEAKAKELDEAFNALKKSARSTVDSLTSGFKALDTSTVTSFDTLIANLDSQTAYMDQYYLNLSNAMGSGLNEGLVAKLADGSEESAAILRGLQETGWDTATVSKLNETWAKNQAAADSMATGMATAQAKVDDTISELTDELLQMIEDANALDDDAYNAGANVVDQLAHGLGDKKSALQTQAQGILDSLSQTFSSANLTIPVSIRVDGQEYDKPTPNSNAKGLGYVPYNDYLTYLHKGEAVLSNAEAERYRAGQAQGGMVLDYDRLGAVIAASLSGAAVQMDGKTVGELVTPTVSRKIQQAAWAGRYDV